MKAYDARDLSERINISSDQKQLTEIFHKIKEATTKGEFHVWYYNSIRKSVESELERLGYKLSFITDKNDLNCKIEW